MVTFEKSQDTTNGSPVLQNHSRDRYTVVEEPIYQPQKIRVVCIGAGISGLALLYTLRDAENVSVTVLEKSEDVGGVWLDNKYPGCGCDIPAHIYTYSFEGNPNWSRYYAEAGEILKYYQAFATKYSLYDNIKFGHEVVGAKWLDAQSVWSVDVLLNGGIKINMEADVLVNAGGALSTCKFPDIVGLKDYKGRIIHSAKWDTTYDFKGKEIAVIGAGASAVQIVPNLQPVVKKIISFNRSKVWIATEFVDQYAADGRNTIYSPEEIDYFNADPEHLVAYRKMLTEKMCQIFDVFYKESVAQKRAFQNNRESMIRRLAGNKELIDKLVPSFPVGCRRATPGSGYLEALTSPNAEVVTNKIVAANEYGLITDDGRQLKVDAIIAATGFDTSFCPIFPLIGLGGRDLRQDWKQSPRAYLCLAASGYPNFFIMNGPNAPFANGSLVYGIEMQAEYIAQVVKKLQTERIRYMNVKPEAVEDWIEHRDEFMKRMAWSGDCVSWYKNGKRDGPVIGPWAGSILHFEQSIKTPRFEDFDIVYKQRNRFGYIGNGRSLTEARGEPLSYYIK